MPTFQYTELDKNGRMLTGNMVAADKAEVVQNIKGKGNRVLKVEQKEEKSKDIGSLALFKPKVKTKDLYIFCRQMSTMLGAGMPLLNSIAVLESQSDNKTLREIFLEMQADLQKGMILSQAMRKHKQFPSMLLNMIEAGEMTGNLDDVLTKMAFHYEKENKINAKIRSAMIYPIVLAVVSIIVIIIILVGLMPMFVKMFETAGVPLPLPTQILIAMSNFVVKYWFILFGGSTALFVGIRRYIKTPQGKYSWDRNLLKIPGVRHQIRMIYTSRFTRTLSTMLSSGIAILDALRLSARVTGNTLVIRGIEEASEAVKKGDFISLTLDKLKLFPSMMISMISIGEESGSIEEMLGKTADYYDQELDEAITKLVALMEPALIIVMGIFVGGSVIAILLPMFDMASIVS